MQGQVQKRGIYCLQGCGEGKVSREDCDPEQVECEEAWGWSLYGLRVEGRCWIRSSKKKWKTRERLGGKLWLDAA